jgi:Capsule assembly protein Wzi/PAP2 superfamily
MPTDPERRQSSSKPVLRVSCRSWGSRIRGWSTALLLAGLTVLAQAQSLPSRPDDVSATAAAQADDRGVRLRSLPRDIFQDQQALFASPFRMGERQWKLAVPLGVLAVGLVASDTAVEGHVTRTPTTVSRASTFSNAGLAALAGVGGGMYVWGAFARNEHQRETGFLSGEAAIDAYLDTSLIKVVAGRDRPFTANGRGNFFDGGSSFPSQHAAVSWAIASVIAHEYPGPLTKFLSYGLAGGVSAARVEAHQHFLSDAVIGSALGWYLGRQVYRARSGDAEIDPRKWGTFERDDGSQQRRAVSQMGSIYVPLDSWMYQVFDRLAAMGYIPTASAVVRPWTRLECARLLAEVHENTGKEDSEENDRIAAPLLESLDGELAHETDLMNGGKNAGAQVESVYARFTGISGTPLRDSFHFAQTLVDDNGRPYGEGANGIAGISQRAEAGPFAIYFRGEYQYASAIPAYNAVAQQTIAASDGLPYGWNLRSGTTNRMRTVEAYAAVNFSNWQLSFGQQNLWWGPDRSTSMILSNNAEAMPMLRLTRVSPSDGPGFLSALGNAHWDFFMAREGGIHYVGLGPNFVLHGTASQPLNPPPYVFGMSFSIKPTENFELGFAHDAIFAGYGRPLNLATFLHTFSISGNGQAVDPGKRTTEFNFAYHVPGLRKYLVLYSEAFSYDNPVEGKFLARFAMNPGIYLPQLPGLRHMDLRVEGVDTNLPGLKNPAYFYSNAHYPQGYTDYGQIFGSWIGRQGSGATATSTYWFSARNRFSTSYRKVVADSSFLQGGQLQDFSGSITWLLRPEIEFSASSQYERWNFPLLAAGARSDVATSFELRFFPSSRFGSVLKQP